jgi:molybdopterin molybdotransferase
MISVREALDRVLDNLPRLSAEQVALAQAPGRALADTIQAPFDVPPFRNSAMDGYAVRAADVAPALDERPVRLRVLETIGAGDVPSGRVTQGTAARIMTGAPLPDGADSVVRVEDTRTLGEEVEVCVSAEVGANVRHPGEDVRAGDIVLGSGRQLRPADIGVLASLGIGRVRVRCRPRVAILSTGNELVDVGEPRGPGQIVNSNAYALAAAVEEAGGIPVSLGIVRDQPDLIRAAFQDALRSDLVLSTGGVSVGSFDYVREILGELGYQERFWKVAQRPGKPLTFGTINDVPVFGLPGNPVSCLVCFHVYVVPALRTMMGCEHPFLPTVQARMAASVPKAKGLTEFVRCTLEGPVDGLRAHSTGTQSSGVLRSLSLGDGLIVGPPDLTVLKEGLAVRVLLLRSETSSPPF